MNRLFIALRYLRYLLTAKTRHGTHSPFIYELVEDVIYREGAFYGYSANAHVFERMAASAKKIEVTDLGAGSHVSGKKVRTVGQIARSAAIPRKYGELMLRLVNRFQPATIVELGTSLGIGTMYMASGKRNSRIVSIEGCPTIADVARKNFKACDFPEIEVRVGHFDEQLPKLLAELETVDFAFVDGNHRREPTLNYFEQLKAKANPNTVLVFDDIHWSAEMEQAWNTIKADPSVTATVDLFRLGLVFFREGMTKQDFVIRY